MYQAQLEALEPRVKREHPARPAVLVQPEQQERLERLDQPDLQDRLERLDI